MEEVDVYLPKDVKRVCESTDFEHVYVLGGRCGYGCENVDSFTLARERAEQFSYKVHYQGAFIKESGVEKMEDTWWGKVIRHFNGELLCCNAFSGCMVSGHRDDGIRFPSAASDERIDDLCSAGIPDILMIYLGTNDWNNLIETNDFEEPWWQTFNGAYDHMLSELRKRLPETDIWCMNLTYSQNMMYYFHPSEFRRIQEFNRVISEAAKRYDAKVIDLWTKAAEYTSSDLAHADQGGMAMIANAIISTVTSHN